MTKRHEEKKVLIIEDEADIRNFACRVLELEGYLVLKAESGEEGLRLVKERHVDLMLLDLRLPECDGWMVLEQLKSKPEFSKIPVVVFTASAGVPQRDRALGMGAKDYLVKPVSVARLKKTIARILRPRR